MRSGDQESSTTNSLNGSTRRQFYPTERSGHRPGRSGHGRQEEQAKVIIIIIIIIIIISCLLRT